MWPGRSDAAARLRFGCTRRCSPLLNEETLPDVYGCGVNMPSPDLLTPAMAATTIWSWAPGQPAAPGGASAPGWLPRWLARWLPIREEQVWLSRLPKAGNPPLLLYVALIPTC